MNATESDVIEETILDDEPACQSRHIYTPVCSTHVAYRVTYCRAPILMCASAVDTPTTGARDRQLGSCASCHRPARECWKIHPV